MRIILLRSWADATWWGTPWHVTDRRRDNSVYQQRWQQFGLSTALATVWSINNAGDSSVCQQY